MKQKRSMDEALEAAKKMRRDLTARGDATTESDSHLSVVENEPCNLSRTQENGPDVAATPPISAPPSPIPTRPIWVRHTVGLRDETSLGLRDAADGQKRKQRYGQLQAGEPANEQEIADLGITLALRKLGYLSE